jgi:hypothetical protein
VQVRQSIPVCNLLSCRDRVSDRLRDLKLPNVPGCPQINAGATCLVLRRSNRLVMQSVTKGIASEETNFAPLELFKNTGKTSKCSIPVLSAQKPWFPQGFLHIWPIALAFCSAHATRCMAPAALHFASRTSNRVVFRVARVA